MAKKSLFVTYVLWLFGGFFGLHHFYLGRDYQALVWWMFGGGYFGLGLIRDLWRIPEYVDDANEEGKYMAKLAASMLREQKPTSGVVRYIGLITVSDAFGYLIIRAIPKEFLPEYLHAVTFALLTPIAVAVGVYLVGNIGRQEGSFSSALKGAYLTFPLYFVDTPVCLTSFASCAVFNSYSKRWRRTPQKPKSLSRRLLFLSFCGFIYLSLWASWGYFNCEITTQDQETVRCRDAAKHFFKSPIWKEFVHVMREIWSAFRERGWWDTWRQLVDAFDPVGEANALQVLGLNSTANQRDITNSYRKLSREWHPDKHKDLDKKEIAQEKFIEIQHAYEILSKIKSQRIAQNIRNPLVEEYVSEEELNTNY